MLLFSTLFVLSASRSPTIYTVNLENPTSNRWTHVQAPYAASIKIFAESYASQVSSTELIAIVDLLKNGYLNPELSSEISALAETVNITYNQAVFLNFMYEWNAYCTSIVVNLTNGTVIHGRNLDYQSSQFLSETAVQINVWKGSKYLYSSTGFAWYLGVGTGIGRGFSVSLNQRDAGGRDATFEALKKGYPGDLWILRKAFIHLESFLEADYYLRSSKLASSTYYMMAGIGEGASITRDRDKVAGYQKIDDENWFQVQCNSDYWTPDPDGRRTTAINALNQIGRENMTVEKLLQVLQTFPVINPTTVFTTLMVPSTGYLNTTIY